jgi:hypothetical protein
MKFHPASVAAFVALFVNSSDAFCPNTASSCGKFQVKMSTAEVEQEIAAKSAATTEGAPSASHTYPGVEKLTVDIVKKLRFRQVQRELELRKLDTTGTFTDMRQRLQNLATVETTNGEHHHHAEQTKKEDVRVIDEDTLNAVSFDSFSTDIFSSMVSSHEAYSLSQNSL